MRLSCSHKETREGVRLRRFGVCAWCVLWTSKDKQEAHLVLRSRLRRPSTKGSACFNQMLTLC